MSSFSQESGHHSSVTIRDGKDVPNATNNAFENTPLLSSLGHKSSGYTDLNNVNTRDPSRIRHGHGASEEFGDLDEADSPLEQSDARRRDIPCQEQRVNASPSLSSSTKPSGLWNTISKRLVFLQRDDENERSPLEKDLVRRLDVFLLTFGCISQGRFRSRDDGRTCERPQDVDGDHVYDLVIK